MKLAWNPVFPNIDTLIGHRTNMNHVIHIHESSLVWDVATYTSLTINAVCCILVCEFLYACSQLWNQMPIKASQYYPHILALIGHQL